MFVSIGLAAYRNLSFVILRRLLTEVNVIMIIIFTVINTSVSRCPYSKISFVVGVVIILYDKANFTV